MKNDIKKTDQILNREYAELSHEKKIKVAFVIWTLIGMGGSERVVYDIARKLDRERYSVIIITFEDGPVRNIYKDIGITVYIISKKKWIDLDFILRLRKVFVMERIDVVNPHHYGPLIYTFIATRNMRTKLIYTEHSRWQLEQLSLIKKMLNMIMLHRSDALIAISKQIEDYYIRNLRIRSEKVHLINNGIDLDIYNKKTNKYLKRSFGLQEHEKVIGIVANLRPEKNHKLLISAFSNVAAIQKDVRLFLIGLDCMGGEAHLFAAKSNASDKIHFLGQREDVPALLSILDLLCLPSKYEGLPLTLLEAMACGVPVIGSDVLGINEVVKHNVNGLLFPPNDEKQLTENLLYLLNDDSLRNRIAEAGRSFVIRNFSLDEKVKEYEQLFSTVVSNE